MISNNSELLNILNETHRYDPLKQITYRSTNTDQIVVAIVPGSTAKYIFELTSDKTLIKAAGINFAGIKVTMYTKTELLHGRRIAPDLILGLSTLFNFDFRFTAEIVASEARVRIKRVRIASEARNVASEAHPAPNQAPSTTVQRQQKLEISKVCSSQSSSLSHSPSRSRFTRLVLRSFLGKGHTF